MSAFEWDECFSVGVRQVDQHNQQLLNLLGNLYTQLNIGADEHLVRLEFRELSDHIVYHFACEEIWTYCTRFGIVTKHRECHNRLKQMFDELYSIFKLGNISIAHKVSVMMTSFIAHIHEFDVIYWQLINGDLSSKLMTKRH